MKRTGIKIVVTIMVLAAIAAIIYHFAVPEPIVGKWTTGGPFNISVTFNRDGTGQITPGSGQLTWKKTADHAYDVSGQAPISMSGQGAISATISATVSSDGQHLDYGSGPVKIQLTREQQELPGG